MWKFIITCTLIIMFFSCSETYYIEYSVQGSAESAIIIYYENGNNYESIESLPWNKYFTIKYSDIVSLYARNLGDGELDARIMFIGKSDWQMYERKRSNDTILIKGKIRSTL